jgi:hypothetical protein
LEARLPLEYSIFIPAYPAVFNMPK